MEYSTKIYSRIGELMQGVLPDSSAFLVGGLSSRRWFSEAVLRRLAPGEAPLPLPPKTSAALAALERSLGIRLPADVGIDLRSNVPWGKGLSSSSTDILSVLSVAASFFGTNLDAGALYRIAAGIEPTDPCLSEDIPIFFQHKGYSFGTVELPPVTLVYFDAAPGTRVETLEMRRDWPAGAGAFFSWLLQRMVTAAAAGDYGCLFDSVTYSAEYNQQTLPLPGFADLYRLASDMELGLVVAHSGTIGGLLARPEQAAELMSRLDALVNHRICPGAPERTIFMEHYSSPYHSSLCPAFTVR